MNYCVELRKNRSSGDNLQVATPTSVLLVELVMSVDRLIQSAKSATTRAGQWAPQIVLGHVSQVDTQVWLPRMQQMITALENGEPEPSFVWWEPDSAQTEMRFKDLSLDDASALVLQSRTNVVTYLRELTTQQWQARAIHSTFGSIDVSELVFQALTHDEEHRASFV